MQIGLSFSSAAGNAIYKDLVSTLVVCVGDVQRLVNVAHPMSQGVRPKKWFFDVSNGIEEVLDWVGDQVDHGYAAWRKCKAAIGHASRTELSTNLLYLQTFLLREVNFLVRHDFLHGVPQPFGDFAALPGSCIIPGIGINRGIGRAAAALKHLA